MENLQIVQLDRSGSGGPRADEARARLGRMVYEAAPEYYRLVPLDKTELQLILEAQIGAPQTEMTETYAARLAGALSGIASVVEVGDLKKIQLNASLGLTRKVSSANRPQFQQALKDYASTVAPITRQEGKYLPRIYVAEEARGRGVARSLISFILGKYADRNVCLHVNRENQAAIRLYKSLGFRLQSNDELAMQLYTRASTGG